MPTTYTQDLAAPLPVVLQARTGVTNTQYLFGMGTRPLAEYDSAWEYLLPDVLGSVRQIADASGYVKLSQSYEPYGSMLASQGSATSAFGFTGEQTDSTGLVFLRARYMQPGLGVFLSRDPWSGNALRSGSMNGWNYVENNPVRHTDPSGHDVGCPGKDAPSDCNKPPPSGKTAYLTFDDGPDPSLTPQIALTLQGRGAQATFFVTGADPSWKRILSTCNPEVVPEIWANVEVVRLIRDTGHAIGIHGWLHTNFWDAEGVNPAEEVKQVENALNAMGVPSDKLLRAPAGQFPGKPIPGYEDWYYFGWDTNSGDDSTQDPKKVIENVLDDLKNNGLPDNPIILLHSIQKHTFDAITNPMYDLLTELHKIGYTQFRKLPRPGDHPGYPPNGRTYTIR